MSNNSLYADRLLKIPHIHLISPGLNGRHFADDIIRCIFVTENIFILIKISPKCVPQGPIHNNPAVIYMIAWRRIFIIWTNGTQFTDSKSRWVKNSAKRTQIEILLMYLYINYHLRVKTIASDSTVKKIWRLGSFYKTNFTNTALVAWHFSSKAIMTGNHFCYEVGGQHCMYYWDCMQIKEMFYVWRRLRASVM